MVGTKRMAGQRTSKQIARARLSGAVARAQRAALPLVLFSLMVNLLLLTMPLYMLQIYDRILPLRSNDTLLYITLLAAGALLVLGLLEAIRAVIASRAAVRLEAALGSSALEAGLARARAGMSDMEPMRDLSTVRAYLSSRAVFAILDFPFAPLFVLVLWFVHPTLALLTAGGMVVLIVLAIVNERATAAASRALSERSGSAGHIAQSVGRNAQAVQAMGMQEGVTRLWGAQAAQALIAQAKLDGRNAWLSGLSRTLRMALQIAILGVGAILVLRNEMTAGMIFAASIISGRALAPIDQIIGAWKQTAMARTSWARLRAALDATPFAEDAIELPAPRGALSVEKLTVAAPGETGARNRSIILRNISFTASPGETVAVVGPSGSGKSTLARCIVGAQPIDAGAVRIDGTEIAHWRADQLGRFVGYVGQETELLPGTVRDNIARFQAGMADGAIVTAAQRAQVHDLIQTLPDGYATRVGPGGLTLSGGQRQRIALARAFFGEPRILVLDEPNANLDEDGEVALARALLGAKEAGVTVLLVTQRPNILKVADSVVRLIGGTLDVHMPVADYVSALQKARMAQRPERPRAQPGAARERDGASVVAMPQAAPGAGAAPPETSAPAAPARVPLSLSATGRVGARPRRHAGAGTIPAPGPGKEER